MSEWALKRFWKTVDVAQVDTGFVVHLDGRKVMTPAKTKLVMPTRALAEKVAAEWDAQADTVRPEAMPLTRLANSALDKVAPQKTAVADMLAEYGGTDLLCYRADGPQALIDRQAAAWDPLLEWATNRYGAELKTVSGVMPVTQDDDALARLAQAVHALDPYTLAGFHDLVSLSGSLIIGLAALTGQDDTGQDNTGQDNTEALWQASRVDELWQEELWGADEEATEHAALRRASFLNADAFCRMCKPAAE